MEQHAKVMAEGRTITDDIGIVQLKQGLLLANSSFGLIDLVRKEKKRLDFLSESLIWIEQFGEKWKGKYQNEIF